MIDNVPIPIDFDIHKDAPSVQCPEELKISGENIVADISALSFEHDPFSREEILEWPFPNLRDSFNSSQCSKTKSSKHVSMSSPSMGKRLLQSSYDPDGGYTTTYASLHDGRARRLYNQSISRETM
ncbi:hypothetical protein GUITHDRAFT_154633, partial [Guillardia theta CCMP2712]